jgi:acetyl esterase
MKSARVSRPSLPERIQAHVARRLFRLPHHLQLRLSGKPQVVVHGQALHPEIQLLLTARKLSGGKPLRADTATLARHSMRKESLQFSTDVPVETVRDLSLDTEVGPLRARHYAPREPGGPHPLLVFFHGGGFVVGDVDTHDEPCRLLCMHAGVHVLSVEYRLAPEHPFPAGLTDAEAALRWALSHATELGADPARVGVGGDSAGGNLSAVLSLYGGKGGAPSPAFQLLIYPATDRKTPYPSQEHFAEGFFLTRGDVDWFDRNYIGDRVELRADPRVSPLLAPELGRLCPAVVVTAGFDPLRDEGDAYAARLAREGTPTRHRTFPGFIHGFLNMGGVSPAAYAAVVDIARELRKLSRGS